MSIKTVVSVVNPLAGLIWDVVENTTKKVDQAASGEMGALQLEAARQEVRLKMAKLQAQVAQEMAIADRIASAEEVELEEFYDAGGKGSVGLTADAKANTASVGFGAEGRVVTKRVYHFKGWRPETIVTQIGKDGDLSIDISDVSDPGPR